MNTVDLLTEARDNATGDLTELATLLHHLRNDIRHLQILARDIEAEVVDLMPGKTAELDGLPVIEVRGGSIRKKWQSEDLVPVLIRKALDPDGTGELPTSPIDAAHAVADVLTACAPFTPSMGWRVGALRDRGLDPDEWCESTPGRKTIQFHEATS